MEQTMFGTDDIFFRSVTQTTEQSARQLRNRSAIPTSQRWSPYNWRSEAANCASPVHGHLSFTAANQQPTCGYSAWLSTAFTCTTMFLGRDQMSPTPGPTAVPCQVQPSHQPAVTHSGQVVRPNPKYLTRCWHTNTHTFTVTHRLRTLCMHELTFPIPCSPLLHPASVDLIFIYFSTQVFRRFPFLS